MGRQTREHSILQLAEEAYAQHEIASSTERSWLIKRPDSGIFWQEIISGFAGTIIVHGDGPDIMFRIYSDRDPLELVRFFAESDLSYIAGKVVNHQLRTEFNEEVAQTRIDELIAEYAGDATKVERLEDLKESLEDEPSPAHALVDATGDIEDAHNFGMVLRADLYYAHAAIRRLGALLKDRIGEKVRP